MKKSVIINIIKSILISFFLMCLLSQTTLTTCLQKGAIWLYLGCLFYALSYYVDKKIKLKNKRILNLVILFVVAISLWMCKDAVIPQNYVDNIIEITILDNADPLSKGKEAWITNVVVNNTKYELSDEIIGKESEWKFSEGALYGDKNQNMSYLKLNIPKATSINVHFSKHAWSGMVLIKSGDFSETLNLFTPNGDEVFFDIPPNRQEYIPIIQVVLFVGATFLTLLILQYIIWGIMKIRKTI